MTRTADDRHNTLAFLQQGATFRAALARFASRTEALCRKHGLSTNQYTLLLMIEGAGDGSRRSTVKELSALLQVAQNGVTERVQRVEDAGLVVRQRSQEDRRVHYILLTDEGRRRLLGAFRDLTYDLTLVEFLDEAVTVFQHEQADSRITRSRRRRSTVSSTAS